MFENENQVAVDGKSLTANVEVVEPMGAEIYVHLELAGWSLTARINTEHPPEVNRPHILDLAMYRAHYFDPDTEETIL